MAAVEVTEGQGLATTESERLGVSVAQAIDKLVIGGYQGIPCCIHCIICVFVLLNVICVCLLNRSVVLTQGRKRHYITLKVAQRAQWLRGRASDSRLRGPGFESCYAVLKPWARFFTLHCSSSLSYINEYLAIGSGGYVYEQHSRIKFSIWLDASQRS